jgi:hypothetical protein
MKAGPPGRGRVPGFLAAKHAQNHTMIAQVIVYIRGLTAPPIGNDASRAMVWRVPYRFHPFPLPAQIEMSFQCGHVVTLPTLPYPGYLSAIRKMMIVAISTAKNAVNRLYANKRS